MTQFELNYRKALASCAERYVRMATDLDLLEFLVLFCDKVPDPEFPLLKLNRWLGYIQGQLIAAKITTVEIERDWTRPLFRPLDFES